MALTQAEFDEILLDGTKTIEGDLFWLNDDDGSPAVEFRTPVESDAGYPLIVCGRYNRLATTLSYALIHRPHGRVCALDLGKAHRNPDRTLVGEKHKHRYEEGYGDKKAYVPPDITHGVDDPVAVWLQFCKEVRIVHRGTLHKPPPIHEESFV